MSIRNFINIINEHTETKKKPVLDNKKTVLKTLHDSIKESKSGIEVTTEIGPESWMSYLLSGDSSDMDSEEIKAADKWQERMEPWFVVSTEGEPFYTNHYNLYSGIPGVFGGNVIEYVMHKSNLNKIEEDDHDHATGEKWYSYDHDKPRTKNPIEKDDHDLATGKKWYSYDHDKPRTKKPN